MQEQIKDMKEQRVNYLHVNSIDIKIIYFHIISCSILKALQTQIVFRTYK
jgi:hypothetical protein